MSPAALDAQDKAISIEIFFTKADLLSLQNAFVCFLWQVIMHTKMFLKAPVNHGLLSSAIKIPLTAYEGSIAPVVVATVKTIKS